MKKILFGISIQLIISDIKKYNKRQSSLYKGQSPQKMQRISIVNRQPSKSMYETDDVLQLQCIGEVESINSIPSKVGLYLTVNTRSFF